MLACIAYKGYNYLFITFYIHNIYNRCTCMLLWSKSLCRLHFDVECRWPAPLLRLTSRNKYHQVKIWYMSLIPRCRMCCCVTPNGRKLLTFQVSNYFLLPLHGKVVLIYSLITINTDKVFAFYSQSVAVAGRYHVLILARGLGEWLQIVITSTIIRNIVFQVSYHTGRGGRGFQIDKRIWPISSGGPKL